MILEARGLAAERGDRVLFSGVSFALSAGEALVVTGANGSGKTTLLRIVAGLTLAAGGELRWRGSAVQPFAAAVRAEILYIGHNSALKDELSAEENLASVTLLHGAKPNPSIVREALSAWSLNRQRSLPARVLSQGQRRRVGLARMSVERRALWVLDEPTTALDAGGAALLRDLLAAHLDRGGVALVATHDDIGLPGSVARTLRLQ
jgi:heme exporter protein A